MKSNKLDNSILNVKITYNENIIAESSQINMISIYSTFTKLFYLNNCFYLDEKLENNYFNIDIVHCSIEIENKFNERILLYNFNFRTDDFKIEKSNIILEGLPMIDYDTSNYDQNVIDVFTKWNNNEKIYFLGLNEEVKYSYNYCCLFWSGVPNLFFDSLYEINLSVVNSEIDFFNLLGEELFGPKGYIGHDSYSFEDCLQTISKNITNKTVIKLINYSNLDLVIDPHTKKFIDRCIEKKYQNFYFLKVEKY